jgi:aminoglycoside 2'-N-acetyltransferase I
MSTMTEIDVVATAGVSTSDLARLRTLLNEAFDGDFSDEDWDHAQGGWHAIAFEDGLPVAHAAVVPRQMHVGEWVLAAGYVEAVATAPTAQGCGHGSRVMMAAMETIRHGFDMGALSTSRCGFYERLGWERWEGPTYVIRDGRRVRTADEDDGIMVLRFGPRQGIPLDAAIACHARPGDDW